MVENDVGGYGHEKRVKQSFRLHLNFSYSGPAFNDVFTQGSV